MGLLCKLVYDILISTQLKYIYFSYRNQLDETRFLVKGIIGARLYRTGSCRGRGEKVLAHQSGRVSVPK